MVELLLVSEFSKSDVSPEGAGFSRSHLDHWIRVSRAHLLGVPQADWLRIPGNWQIEVFPSVERKPSSNLDNGLHSDPGR